jgi:hypothetical protein
MSSYYGVLDFHAERQNSGVPTYWDGWYTDRADAISVLRMLRKKSPGANISLVEQLDDRELGQPCRFEGSEQFGGVVCR